VTTTSPVRVTPRDVARILFRHKRKIALTFTGTIVLTLLAVMVWPRSYSSEARLFIRVGRESVALDPTATTGQTIMLQKTQEDEVNSALEIIGSSEVLNRVVETVGADRILGETAVRGSPDPAQHAGDLRSREWHGQETGHNVDRARSWLDTWMTALRLSEPGTAEDLAVRRLKKEMSVWAPKQSTVIGVRYVAETPTLARDVVAAATDAFLETHLRLNHTSGSLAFFSEQADLLHGQLTAAEAELRDRKNEYQLASSSSKRQILEQQISNVELELLQNERELKFSEAKIADLTGQIAGLEPELVTNRVVGFANEAKDSMREKLYGLELQESQLRSRYTDQHPLLVQIVEQRKLAEDILTSMPDDRTQTTESLNPNQRLLELELMREKASSGALRARRGSATAQHERLYRQLKDLNDQELELAQLERKVQLLDGKYRTHVDKLEQARVNDALEQERISNINVVQPATLVLKPASPNKRLMLALGLVVATCGGLGLAIIAESLDQTLRTTEQVEAQLGLPVLLSLPARARRRRHRVVRGSPDPAPVAAATINGTNGQCVPPADRPRHVPARAIGGKRYISRRLCHGTGFSRKDFQALAAQLRAGIPCAGAKPRMVGVMGFQSGRYGSEVAANLAIEAAKAWPDRVLFVEAAAAGHTVDNYRFRIADCRLEKLNPQSIANLAVMTADGVPQPSDDGDGVVQLQQLKEQYGLIVVDLPPVRGPDAAAPTTGWVNEVILVLEAERTRIQAAQRVKDQLERAGVRLLGVVLKNRREYVPKWLYRRL
jgi:uncharacterized protein involved in exopolysaccharide biosynthesis